jgi:peroxiredoxin
MLKIGEKVNGFQLPDSAGRPQTLGALQERGPVLVAFFKVSCPVCQYTFPYLDRIAASGQVPVIGISQDNARATDDFREEFEVHFPLLLDAANSGYQVSNAFGITHVPTMFVVEKDGSISHTSSGFSRVDLEELGRRFLTRVFADGERTPDFRPG